MVTTKKAILAFAVCTGITLNAPAQQFKTFIHRGVNTVDHGKGNQKSGGLTQTDISEGLRQALQVGAKNATGKLSLKNGFFGDALVKVLMPPEAKKVETTLREIGMGQYVDDAVLAMNRAAEDASAKALDVFVTAIKNMSIQDALSILNGGNDAATQYLKAKTTAQLTSAFRPIIQQSLNKVNATKYWSTVFTTYNKLPTTFHKINPDLPAYVTERALNGVFVYVAQEEGKIRKDPAAQVTDLLKKVFGSH